MGNTNKKPDLRPLDPPLRRSWKDAVPDMTLEELLATIFRPQALGKHKARSKP